VEPEQRTRHRPFDLREFQNGNAAARLENAMHFPETAIVVCKIAKTEGSGDEIQGLVRKRQGQSIGGQELGPRRAFASGAFEFSTALLARNFKHGMAEVRSDDTP